MDSFSIIQHFFTRMQCNLCDTPFEPEGIQLLNEEAGVYVVSVSCRTCDRQIGVAMVGVENSDLSAPPPTPYRDPELTEEEQERLAEFAPISYDDVLQAHQFFEDLDSGWTKFIPAETLERCTGSYMESTD